MEKDFRSSLSLFYKQKYAHHSFLSPVPQYLFLYFIVSELMPNVDFLGHTLDFQDFLSTFFYAS